LNFEPRTLNLFLVLIVLTAFGSAPALADIYSFTDEGGVTCFTNVPGQGRSKVRLPLKKATAHSSKIALAASIQAYEPVIASASQGFAVDPDLVRAVIKAESNFNPQAVSPKGALGLMQLMPGTAREMGVSHPFDPAENILGGVKYLSQLLGVVNGDIPLALAAYNAGPSRVMGQNEIPPIAETRNYVERVLKHYKNLKGRLEL
jgi:soluble lytic murein transglycosylase-like protein